MGSSDAAAVQKLEKHLNLLKEEYTKLQRGYADLELKYSKIVEKSVDSDSVGEFTCFVTRLSLTVASLYGRNAFSDLKIKIGSKFMPAHKFVLHARSEKWSEDVLIEINELNWSYLGEDIAMALLRWIYMDFVELQHDELALGLLRAAHRFHLPGLLGLCERALVASVGIRSCVRFYCAAEEVGAASLLDYCSGLISTHWGDLTSQDFEHMSGQLLFKMLNSKTKYPLHGAVKLLREDVVLLCLTGNNENVSNLANSLSENGDLPLQIALAKKNLPIAQMLVKNGLASVDEYDGEGCTLLIDALKNRNTFAANFLLEQECLVDLKSRSSGETALHIICALSPEAIQLDVYQNLMQVGRKIMKKNVDINTQNIRGESPLHIAILSQNIDMIDLLLVASNIDINLQTEYEKCALELSLNQETRCRNEEQNKFHVAEKLLRHGANPNPLKSVTNDHLLLVLTKKQLEDSAIFLADYACLDHINVDGFSSLHIASKNKMARLVEKLLNVGASPNLQSDVSYLKTAIHLAVEVNAKNVLEKFANFRNEPNNCKEKPDFNCKDANGTTPLSLSLALNHTLLVPTLILGGADVNARNGQGCTLLHQAIIQRDTDIAVFLLDQGADMNALTLNQESVLELAVQYNLPKVVDSLCTRGVALSARNNDIDPPLWTALNLGLEEVSEVLIRHGVDTDNWSTGPNGCQQTLLHRAIDENNENVAVFLIRNNCDLNSPRQRGPNGEGDDEANEKATPLHLCSQWGLIKVLQTLIDHGANVNAVDNDHKTPLHVAIKNHMEEIINILLCHPGIDLKKRDKDGNSCFATALFVRNHKAAQRILDRFPNAAEQMDQRGRNFLHLAIMNDDLESVLFLLAIQVDVNSRVHDANQSTPLHLAAASHNEMITRNLILAGANINDRDFVQKMPLHVAVERGNLLAVSALIQNNADYDATDSEGNNALHIAVRGGHLSIVRELLTESRVNAESINLKGRNPLHELCRTGEDNTAAAICELFLECMPKYPINAIDMDGNTALLLSFMRGQAPLSKVLVKNGACLGTENRDGLSIFNFKLATDQLLYKLLDQLPQESPWSESDLCQECGSKFSLTMRKHHCRHCGRVLCSKCSNNVVPIIKFGINKPVRVCKVCFSILQGGNGVL